MARIASDSHDSRLIPMGSESVGILWSVIEVKSDVKTSI